MTDKEKIDQYKQLAAAVYQAAGAYDMPARVLDALSAAANGEEFTADGILPVCAPVSADPEGACKEEAYSKMDRFLRLNLDDEDYAEYSKYLDDVYTAHVATQAQPRPTVTAGMVREAEAVMIRARGPFLRQVKDAIEAALDVAQQDGQFTAQSQQPVSGADGLPTERVLIDGTAYELPSAVAAELLRLHLEILGAEQERAELAQQDADKVDVALAEMVHAMFRSGNSVPVTRITIDRKQYEATIDAARKEQA